jgi:glutathione peroxidase
MISPFLRSFLLGAVALVMLPAAQAAGCPTLLNREIPRLQDEKPQSLCRYAGQVVVVVNTASFCGFTPQYRALEALNARYAARGLVVLGFPSNDFGSQEPGNNKDIAAFCENTYGVKFPMFVKSRVVASPGAGINPLFAELVRRTGQSPGWNFHKYVIARDGETVSSFASEIDPQSDAFVQAIERLLNAK